MSDDNYVAIGPSKDLSITVSNHSFNIGLTVFAILFGIGLLIVVGVAIFFAYKGFLLPPPPPPLPINRPNQLHINRGAAPSPHAPPQDHIFDKPLSPDICHLSPHAKWQGDSCECEEHFFGPTCSFEKHDRKYFSLGTPKRETLQLSIIEETFTKRKSFEEMDSCSGKCDANDDCIGFMYENGHCTLLKDNVTVSAGYTIPYSPDEETTLYMRSRDHLNFEDRIFLAGFASSIPPRFWLVTESDNYTQLTPYQIRPLNFIPLIVKAHGLLTGIYCRHPFSLDDIDILLERGDTSECYIHRYNTPINVPVDWIHEAKHGLLHVVYI